MDPSPSSAASAADLRRRFAGVANVYGARALARFAAAHVCVVGVGGVGSWAVEALARSGIGRATLIDADIVVESNVNRQLCALSAEIGRAKVAVLAERIAGINPQCAVDTIEEQVDGDNAQRLLDRGCDVVLDCADAFRAKAAMIAWCRARERPILTVGGAGGMRDPLRIRVDDLSRTRADALLARTRKQLRARHGFPRTAGQPFDVPCVYSLEQPVYASAGGIGPARPPDRAAAGLSCAGSLGSSMPVTAAFGLIAAAQVLDWLAGAPASSARRVCRS